MLNYKVTSHDWMLIRNGHNINFWKRRWLSSFSGLLTFVSNSFAIHCLLCIMDRIFEWKPVTFWLGSLYGYLHCWNSHEFMPHYWWAFLSPYSGYIAHCESLGTVVNLSHVFRFYSLFSRSFASGNFLQKFFDCLHTRRRSLARLLWPLWIYLPSPTTTPT